MFQTPRSCRPHWSGFTCNCEMGIQCCRQDYNWIILSTHLGRRIWNLKHPDIRCNTYLNLYLRIMLSQKQKACFFACIKTALRLGNLMTQDNNVISKDPKFKLFWQIYSSLITYPQIMCMILKTKQTLSLMKQSPYKYF